MNLENTNHWQTFCRYYYVWIGYHIILSASTRRNQTFTSHHIPHLTYWRKYLGDLHKTNSKETAMRHKVFDVYLSHKNMLTVRPPRTFVSHVNSVRGHRHVRYGCAPTRRWTFKKVPYSWQIVHRVTLKNVSVLKPPLN